MAHPAQMNFVELAKKRFPQLFERTRVIEVGSLDINGSVRELFVNPAKYIGCDLVEGRGVDLVCRGHELPYPDQSFDVAISCEALEHDKNWEATFQKMWSLTREGGIVVFTCATEGRSTHGTSDFYPNDSPATNDYYRNLTTGDFKKVFDLGSMFSEYEFYPSGTDLYFWGIKSYKKGHARERLAIEKVVMSADGNPLYLDFWPVVSKVWKLKFGIEPVLLFFGDKSIHNVSEEYGKVVEFPVIPDVPVYLQALWSRYWYLQTEPETVFTISDIDMIPLARSYFVDLVSGFSNDSYLHINPVIQRNGGLPSCYHIAKGRVFSDVLELDSEWERSVRFLNGLNVGTDPGNGCMNWFADEKYAGDKLLAKIVSDSRIVFAHRDGGQNGHRIDRLDWRFDLQAVREERYYDCHCPRPFSENREDIERIVEAAISGNRP